MVHLEQIYGKLYLLGYNDAMKLIEITTNNIKGIGFWCDNNTVSWAIRDKLNTNDYVQLSVSLSSGNTWVDRWVSGIRKWNVQLS